ncbi:DcaP family trimeric outer membrane transporter [Pseudoalteromonas denitrificans]|uniref:Porin subfamily protein n=1 Tax=Pseudoalteromonas denitrificans DSM 6059 TaxID=1123010 RepID=A0A1I1E5Z8_9GAMM|nr:DcaP family trimeric outer membrane transporter [Pseudoalteromonas denitrificans]SFB82537.1 Porin subfamily protein [Pseudoalteromonas denitrificans DSM 6059]
MTNIKLIKKLTITTILAAISSSANATYLENTQVKYGGYIKLDTIWSDYSDSSEDGSVYDGLGRDFYVPSTTPVGSGVNNPDAVFDMHARQSRFNFSTLSKLDSGKSIKTKIELDFIVSPGGNERVSNSHAPRIRQAFITYDGWLFGQAWSNFQNVSVLPETLDFVGPAEGTIFVRQSQIRYTTGGISLSIENPESTVTVNKSRIETDDASLPDFNAKYTHKSEWGHIAVAGLIRQLTYKAQGIDTDETAYGVSLSGRINVGKNNFKFMLNQGSGLGRYVGLNIAHGGVLTSNNNIEAIDSTSGFLAYQHNWSTQIRSTFLYSFIEIENDINLLNLTGDPTQSSISYSANLLYSPEKKLTFGIEFKHANREVESGLEGDLNRLQFSAKYSF